MKVTGTSLSRIFDGFQYKRLEKEFIEPSSLGALISLVGVAVFCYLGLSETVSWLAVRPSEAVSLAEPHAPGALLPLRFNITFPRIPCALLSLATYDALGTSVINVSSGSQVHFYKWSASGQGALTRSGMGVVEFSGRALEEATAGDAAALAAGDGGAMGGLGLPQPEGGAGATPLTMANFEAFVKDRKLAFVTFGAPWCPWCQRLKPVWDEVANIVSNTVPGLGVGAVDCTLPEAVELCQAQHIQAFPTIQLYAEGIPHSHLSYSGPRTKEALLAWLVRAEQLGDALVTAPDAAHAALVGHGDSGEEAAAHAAAREKLLAAMAAPEDSDSDPAAPGPALALIEALHRAGIHAPGDNARAAAGDAAGAALAAAAAEAASEAVVAAAAAAAAAAASGGVAAAAAAAAAAVPPPSGCQIVGEVGLKRIPGRIVFRVGGGPGGLSAAAGSVNLTHAIHTLYFGEERLTQLQWRRVSSASSSASGSSASTVAGRLSNSIHLSTSPFVSHTHFLSVVPHVYKFSTGHTVAPFAYTAESDVTTSAVTFGAGEGAAGGGEQQPTPPTLTLAYHFSPLQINVTEARRGMWQWVVSMAAILGGVVTALSILDSVLHTAAGALSKKRS